MTLCISNPRKKGDDVQIRYALSLSIVKPISARAKAWFKENTGSTERQLIADRRGEDSFTALIDGFEQLGFQVVVNPPSNTTAIRKIVSERLDRWRKSQIVM